MSNEFYELFERASTLIHLALGLVLLLAAFAEAWSARKPESRSGLAGGALFLLGGAAVFAIMVALPGGGSVQGLRDAFAERGGFRIFLAFASLYGAAGLAQLTHALSGREKSFWRAAFLLLLAGAGSAFFVLPHRLAAEARPGAMLPHTLAAAALIAACTSGFVHHITGRRFARALLAAFLFAASLPLLAYKEDPRSFGPRRQTLQSVLIPPGK